MPLTISRMCKAFGSKTVFEDFSYTFPSAGVVWVRGPSGCGKTTLLRLIAGLEQPDLGEVRLPQDSRISMVFQEDRLLDTVTAQDNILAVLGKRTGESIHLANVCLERCGLGGERENDPLQMSGGMRRRVSIARAIAYGGDILLLDEPFKGLDKAIKNRVMEFVFEEKRRLTLLVTHDQEEADRCADWLLQLN